MKLALILLSSMLLTSTVHGQDEDSLGAAAQKAVQQSKLTLLGSTPFHLKAEILQTNNKNSDYRTKIEEFWVSPTQWKRTIESPNFSQSLIVNGDSRFEKNTGDYFPLWLNHLATVIVDPLPMLESIQQSDEELAQSGFSNSNTVCADIHARVDRWIFCFEGDEGLLTSFFTKGYAATLTDYKNFGGKRVARRITINPEPGVSLEAHVTELEKLSDPDSRSFAVENPTPASERIKSVRIDEDAFRRLSQDSTEIDWLPQGGGPETGGCAIYVSADRTGHIREIWPAGCDSTGIGDALPELVKKWHLKPATDSEGNPVQVEALLGFTFHTQVDNSHPLPVLSDVEARKLASHTVKPVFPPGGDKTVSEYVVRVSVNEEGKVTGLLNTHKLNASILMAINQAVTKWHFRPYLQNGKPQYFNADLTFPAR